MINDFIINDDQINHNLNFIENRIKNHSEIKKSVFQELITAYSKDNIGLVVDCGINIFCVGNL